MKKEKQIDRIIRFEKIYDEIQTALSDNCSFELLASLKPKVKELEAYYTGKEWKKDFADEEAGLFSNDLKRGILSQDAIYDLLENYDLLTKNHIGFDGSTEIKKGFEDVETGKEITNSDIKLLDMAKNAAGNAYCPYSGFHVGAALLCNDGRIYTGCNIENSSYGVTVCAERVAVFKAVADGERFFKIIAVYSPDGEHCPPCGVCRQVLSEFSYDMYVIYRGINGKTVKKKLCELLTDCFGKSQT